MAFGRYTAECIGYATTKCSACSLFCSYKIKNITLSGLKNNSKSALQNPMHLKLKIAEHRIANMICPNDIL